MEVPRVDVHIQLNYSFLYGGYRKNLSYDYHRRKLYDKHLCNQVLFPESILNCFEYQILQTCDSFYQTRPTMASKNLFEQILIIIQRLIMNIV